MMLHVASALPSSMKRIWLCGEIFPSSIRRVTSRRNNFEERGRTASSL